MDANSICTNQTLFLMLFPDATSLAVSTERLQDLVCRFDLNALSSELLTGVDGLATFYEKVGMRYSISSGIFK